MLRKTQDDRAKRGACARPTATPVPAPRQRLCPPRGNAYARRPTATACARPAATPVPAPARRPHRSPLAARDVSSQANRWNIVS